MKRIAFRTLAAVSPLLVLLGLELTLRLLGLGHPTRFFLPATVGGQKVLIENSRFAWQFLPSAIARSPTPTVIATPKPPGTIRILLFGESAALGDPRPAYGFGRYLEVLLNGRFPDQRFEVVCAAMTAVNSHAVRLLARECVRLEGDLWIVYLGNNEMEGPYGVANPFGLRAPPVEVVRTMLALKRTYVGQFVVSWLDRRRPARDATQAWAGLKTMARQLVAPDEPAKQAVYRSFARNLDDILEAARQARVPVLLSTLACNLRECGPFASFPNPRLGDAERARIAELRAAAVAAITNQQPTAAITAYQTALRLDPDHAELHFRLGHAFLAATNQDQARHAFERARDADALPFRADTRFNEIIRQTATRHDGHGVALFDADAVLSSDAPGHSPGAEVFFEHVHLNFDGNFRLARALAAQIQSLLPPAVTAKGRADWLDAEACARRLGLTDWNRFGVLEQVLQRLQDAPFTNQLGNPSRLRALQGELVRLKSEMQPRNYLDARAVYDEALVLAPGDFRLHENYAEFLEATGEYAEARQQWERVRDLVPHHLLAYYHLARLQTRLGDYAAASQNLGEALRRRPDFTEARLALGQNLAKQGQLDSAAAEYRAVLRQQPGNPTALLRLADVLAAAGRRAEAFASLEEAVRQQPNSWEARYFLGIELVVQEKIAEARDQFAEVVRLRPDFALGHLNYGVALARLGQVREAYGHFRATLMLEPGNEKAAEYMKSIEAAAQAGPKPEARPAP